MPRYGLQDGEIYYETSGSGPPLLLIHGLGSSLRDWENQLDVFARTFRVVACDLRGHGRSQHFRGSYTIPDFAGDMAGLIDGLGMAPVMVVGISMGGMVAFQLALDRPDLVARLVAVNTLPKVELSSLRAWWEIGQRFFLTRILGMRMTGLILSRRLFPGSDQKSLREKFARRWAENDPAVYLAAVRGLLGWSVEGRLATLKCRTLVVAGEKDFIPLREKKRYMDKIPQSRLTVIRDSGHASPADRPLEFNRIVLEYLKTQDG